MNSTSFLWCSFWGVYLSSDVTKSLVFDVQSSESSCCGVAFGMSKYLAK